MSASQQVLEELKIGQPLTFDLVGPEGVVLSSGHVLRAWELDCLLNSPAGVSKEPARANTTILQKLRRSRRRVAHALERSAKHAYFPLLINDIAQDIAHSASRNANLVMASTQLCPDSHSAVLHVCNTASIAACVIRQLPTLAEEQRETVLCACLTMNISVMELYEELVRQVEGLTLSQQERIHRHPQDAVARLRELGVNDSRWLDAVLMHHELHDGSGYPQHLHASDISPLAHLVTLADQFCARISPRKYRTAHSSQSVLRTWLLDRGQQFDTNLTAYFIKTLGLYPAGSLVALRNGIQGLVIRQSERIDQPQVYGLLDAAGQPLPRGSVFPTDDRQHAVATALTAHPLPLGVRLSQIWGSEAEDDPFVAETAAVYSTAERPPSTGSTTPVT